MWERERKGLRWQVCAAVGVESQLRVCLCTAVCGIVRVCVEGAGEIFLRRVPSLSWVDRLVSAATVDGCVPRNRAIKFEETGLTQAELGCWSNSEQGCVISEAAISYISWDLRTPVIRLITFRADIISAWALGKLL